MKIKLPWVSRKEFEKVKSQKEVAENRLQSTEREYVNLRDELTPKILKIWEKIAKTQWKRHNPPSRKYCIVVELDEYIIHDALIHGDNCHELSYMAKYIGDMAVRSIREINQARYVDEPKKRGYRMPTFKESNLFLP